MLSLEELEKMMARWMVVDPRCPKCGKVHPRKHVANSMTFEVKVENCSYRGSIPMKQFE